MKNKDKLAEECFDKIMQELDVMCTDCVIKKWEKHINAFSKRYIEYFDKINAKVVELKTKDNKNE